MGTLLSQCSGFENLDEKSIESITNSIRNIEQQIRKGILTQSDYEKVQSELIKYSRILRKKRHENTEVDTAQKLILSITEEVLEKRHKSGFGSQKSLESSSKRIRASGSQRSILKTREAPTEKTTFIPKSSSIILETIEQKLEALTNDVKVAETNKDKSGLHFLSRSVENLIADLQAVQINDEVHNEERKELLEKNLQRVYQEIEEIKTQVTEENDLKNSKELQKKEEKEKCLHDLEKIHHQLMEIGRSLSIQNFQKQREVFNVLKNEVNSFQEIDEEVALKKSKVSNVMVNVENAFTRFEMEDKLNQVEWKHFQYKLDLSKFLDTTDSEMYKKYKLYLEQLKDYVCKIPEMNSKMDEKKKYILYNIENNIAALVKRGRENEEKLQAQKVKLRRNVTKTKIMNLLNDVKEVQTDYTSRELQTIFPRLMEAKSILDGKLSLLTNQKKLDEHDKKQVASPVVAAVPPNRNNFNDIQKDVEALQIRIENSRCTKKSQLYKDIKNELEGYKSKVLNSKEDGSKSRENLLQCIDDSLLFLENNISSRKNSIEDVLINIMSMSARVNELGGKLEDSSYAIQKYDSIKSSLQEYKIFLEKRKVTSNGDNVNNLIDDIVQQIDKYFKKLEDIKRNPHSTASEEDETISHDNRCNGELLELSSSLGLKSGIAISQLVLIVCCICVVLFLFWWLTT